MGDLAESIRNRLNTTKLGKTMVHLPIVDSTNDAARKAAQEGGPSGLVILADQQTAGRGRMGRTWVGAGGSLLISLLLRPTFPAPKLFVLTMLSATAVREAIRDVCGLHCELKWPNDLLLNGKKLGGILTEASLHGELVDFAIVGIGVNVNLDVRQYPQISRSATSLSHTLGEKIDREDLLCAILEQIDVRYGQAERGDFEAIFQEWRSALAHLGRRVKIVDREQVLEGIAIDVDAEGTLLLRTDQGAMVRVVTGDVSLRDTSDHPISGTGACSSS